jgi:RNA 3'-terminal phosphate cyclase (ATP)
MIRIDGRYGEGGGQILRSSLSLSCLTGEPVHVQNVRAGRGRPGLLRQHLCCVRAAAAVCGAEVQGDTMGSGEVRFRPGVLRGGAYRFAVGSAGSAGLVLQTVLLPLLAADGPSEVVLEGGTHNPASPPADALVRSFLPLLRRMGAEIELTVERAGFHPAGGGRYRLTVQPGPLQPLDLLERGPVQLSVEARVANLPRHIAHREVVAASRRLGLDPAAQRVEEVDADGPGNVVLVTAHDGAHTEVFSAFGRHGARAERVGREAGDATRAWMATGAPVGPHLADQLLLPLAWAGGGAFRTSKVTAHTRTNVHTLSAFLEVPIEIRDETAGALVTVGGSASA